jgi:hypothetical protein
MLFWVALVIFSLPLVYVITSNNKVKRERNQKLEAIQKRLAEKEREEMLKRSKTDD